MLCLLIGAAWIILCLIIPYFRYEFGGGTPPRGRKEELQIKKLQKNAIFHLTRSLSSATVTPMIKVLYFILSLIAGLTVGVILAAFLAITVFFQTLLSFPVSVYLRSMENYSGNSPRSSNKPEDVWYRHIARMEKKKQQLKDHNQV